MQVQLKDKLMNFVTWPAVSDTASTCQLAILISCCCYSVAAVTHVTSSSYTVPCVCVVYCDMGIHMT